MRFVNFDDFAIQHISFFWQTKETCVVMYFISLSTFRNHKIVQRSFKTFSINHEFKFHYFYVIACMHVK